MIEALAGTEPMNRSAYAFCHGERGAVSTSSMPIAFVVAVECGPQKFKSADLSEFPADH
jgi:hypothetical protein